MAHFLDGWAVRDSEWSAVMDHLPRYYNDPILDQLLPCGCYRDTHANESEMEAWRERNGEDDAPETGFGERC